MLWLRWPGHCASGGAGKKDNGKKGRRERPPCAWSKSIYPPLFTPPPVDPFPPPFPPTHSHLQLGRFSRIARPGFTLLAWPFQYFAGAVSLRVQQTDVRVTSKTADDVFVDIHVSVQFAVEESSAFNAYYRLTNPVQQIQAFIFDTVRSTAPKLTLTEIFVKKEVGMEWRRGAKMGRVDVFSSSSPNPPLHTFPGHRRRRPLGAHQDGRRVGLPNH